MTQPKLRFPNFDGDWQSFKFDEIAERVSKTSTQAELPRVEYEDVISGSGVLNKDIFLKHSTKKGIEFKAGDVLFGKLRPYLQNWLHPDFKGIAVGDWWVLRSNMVQNNYLYYLIQSDSFQTVANLSAGSKMPRSDWKIVAKTDFFIPTDKTEQTAIGNFFRQLDGLITLHQRKLDHTKQLKKGLLQKMFPKNGETVPELRFGEFTDAWEQCKLGEVGETFTGLSGKTKDDFGHGEAKYITYLNVFKNPIADLTEIGAIEIDEKQETVKYGDVLFTTSSETPEEVGMSSVWLGNIDNVYLNSFCFGYRPTVEFNPYYLGAVLRSSNVRQDIVLLAQGISRYNISKKKMMEIEIPIPTLAEQTAIGNFFRQLDGLITLHQRKLDNLKTLKKALLQQMFV